MNLIYRDDSLLVVNKPAGLLAVPGRGADKQDCLSARILKKFPDALVVHRLDMATSGLIVFARGEEMQRRLSRMFREREVRKHYIAVVTGQLEPDSGTIDLPLNADWPNRPLQKIDHESGKPSLTHYRVLSRKADATRVELEPVTGRTHQLRLHLASIGHPIIGDTLYGGRIAARLLLHAQMLSLVLPLTDKRQSFSCEPPF